VVKVAWFLKGEYVKLCSIRISTTTKPFMRTGAKGNQGAGGICESQNNIRFLEILIVTSAAQNRKPEIEDADKEMTYSEVLCCHSG
jgi:hypothetical protein